MKLLRSHSPPCFIIMLLSFHSIIYIKTEIGRKKSSFLFIEDEIWKHNFTRNCTCNQMIVHNLQLQHCPKECFSSSSVFLKRAIWWFNNLCDFISFIILFYCSQILWLQLVYNIQCEIFEQTLFIRISYS